MIRRGRARLVSDERGMVTVEAAIAIASIVAAVVMGVVGIVAVAAHVRCIDAAREAARIAAQGDSGRAEEVAAQVGPRGAQVQMQALDAQAVHAAARTRQAMMDPADEVFA